MLAETFSKIFDGNTQRYLEGYLKEGKKITNQPHGIFPIQSHLNPNEPKFYGRSPIKYTNEGKGLCRWVGLDVDLELSPKEACRKAWSIDPEVFPFGSSNGKWHFYKFFDDFVEIEEAKRIRDNLVNQFNIIGLKCDKDKCLPSGYDLEKKTPGNQLYLPRFYDKTKCYSPRGEVLNEDQFLFRLKHKKHPLISGSVGLKSGSGDTGGRQKVLFEIATYLRHTKYQNESFLDEVNNNFNDPEDDNQVNHAIKQSYQYDLKYFVDHYATYTEKLCGWPLPLSEALKEVLDEPGNEKIAKQYEEPEKANAVMGFQERIVYCKLEDLFYDRHTWSEYKERAINHTFQHEFKTKPSLIFSKNPGKLIVESTAFRPDLYDPDKQIFEEDNKLYFNDYKPKGVDMLGPDECDLYEYYVKDLFLRNLENIFLDKEEYLDYFLDWTANIIQRPGEKIRKIPFICSKTKQLGKGLYFQTIQKILHKDHVKLITTGTALDKGMTFLHRSLFVLIDEVYLRGDKKKLAVLMDRFKRLATEQEHSVRTLYQDYRTIYSNTNFIMFSNRPDALEFDEKEVRYFVINSTADRIEEPEKFYDDYFYDALRDGKLAECVKHFLYHRKIKTYEDLTPDQKKEGKPIVPLFTPTNVAWQTEDFLERAKNSASDSERLSKQLVEERDDPFRFDVVCISEVHKYLTEEYKTYTDSLNELAEAFTDLGYKSLGRVKHAKSDKKPTLWIVRNISEYDKFPNTNIADYYWVPQVLNKYNMELADQRVIENQIKEIIVDQEDEEAPY